MTSRRIQIQVQNFSFRYYDSEKDALSNINLNFYEGECICITGASGSGKTSLALAICGFIPHTIGGEINGKILLQEIPSIDLSISDISQFIGLVQQDPENQLVTPTVLEEVAFGPENLCLPRNEILDRVESSTQNTDLNSLLFRSTNELSGGEKQRVAIASILAMRPQVIVLDEPTSFLDFRSVQKLISVLKELNQKENTTIIIIEHRPYMFKAFLDRLIILNHGKVNRDLKKTEVNFQALKIPNEIFQAIHQIRPKQDPEINLDIHQLNTILKNREVLTEISAVFKRGQIYGIMGPNGAGKTTLLQTILNLIPSNGNIYFNREDISEIPTYQLAKNIGLIFQNPNHQIFEKNVLDEITFAPKNFKQDLNNIIPRAKQLLKHASLDSYTNRPPFGLSYGEKRRLNIYSVMIYEPEIMLLDEPFIGQDPANIESLLQLLKERKLKEQTTVIVSHRTELLDFADYIFVLDQGRIAVQGTPTDVVPFLRKTEMIDFSMDLV